MAGLTAGDIAPPMKVEPCDFVSKCMSSPQSYGSSLAYWQSKSIEAISKIADAALAEAWRKTQEVHAANGPALAHNKAMKDRITALMQAVGVPAKWRDRDHKSRARYTKYIDKPAGYIDDLNRHYITYDGFTAAQSTYTTLLQRYAEYRKSADKEKAEKEAAAMAAVAARQADMDFARVLVRYDLPAESEWSDVLEALRSRNKYLDLALAMERVRGDWSEGCDAVTDAMARFSIESEQDKNIAADVLGCTRDFDDGRVFRDTRWSYNALYALIEDQQLVTDARKALDETRS